MGLDLLKFIWKGKKTALQPKNNMVKNSHIIAFGKANVFGEKVANCKNSATS